ncbi:MAG: DUF1080 domain-containing protein [Acidobacteria bacterium]|nr:DUF1080 domain-containing protein [Acidobacteriota bacterium]
MKKVLGLCVVSLLLIASLGFSQTKKKSNGWVSIFDGKSLDGWKASENAATFKVENGAIVVDGPRAHLYYVGPVMDHNFKDFEFKADIMTMPGANSGMYFHTEYQDTGWPAKGYEVQVNNTHGDPRKTGSLYAIKDVNPAPAKDNEWFTQHIIVEGKRVRIMVNGKTTVDYTEPENAERPANMAGRLISSGTIALQGHDPKSRILYKNIMVRALPKKR